MADRKFALAQILAAAARSRMPTKYLAIAGVVIGIGLLQICNPRDPHRFGSRLWIVARHFASRPHQMHVGIGAIMIGNT